MNSTLSENHRLRGRLVNREVLYFRGSENNELVGHFIRRNIFCSWSAIFGPHRVHFEYFVRTRLMLYA